MPARFAGPDSPLADGVSTIVYVLETAEPDEDWISSVQRSCGDVVTFVQGLVRAMARLRLFIFTHGAQKTRAGDCPCPSHAATWGIVRSIRREHPELNIRLVDLDPELLPPDQCAAIRAEVCRTNHAGDSAWRAGMRFEPYIAASSGRESFRLDIARRGGFDGLEKRAHKRRSPAIGEVEVQLDYWALNFRDVLNTLGLYPGDGPLGAECAGRVAAVGPGVDGLNVGDEVVAIGTGTFVSHFTQDAKWVAKIPPGIALPDAVTLPIAFVTALYAIEAVGRFRAGERLLVHAAAGGVGLAALQRARFLGLEVFATAGTESKREYLRGLGVRNVFDSRTDDFARRIMEVTAGEGVHGVLNSLTGPAVAAGFQCLARQGRFLELGKRGVLTAKAARALREDVAYHVLDWLTEPPALIQHIFRQVMNEAGAGTIRPIPGSTFALDDYQAAFRTMAQGRHTGKILINVGEPALRLRKNATYLITGGLGALGLATAEWMKASGATRVVAVGRSAGMPSARRRAVDLSIETHCCDVADLTEVTALVEQLRKTGPPLAGVIHAAGILDDSPAIGLTWERIRRVFDAKVAGAIHLEKATAADVLDFFVVYSSVASLAGPAGQGSYAAANHFLDAWIESRNARRLPALSIQWGPWTSGMFQAHTHQNWAERWSGIRAFQPHEGIECLGRLLGLSGQRIALQAGPLVASGVLGNVPGPLQDEISPSVVPEMNLPAIRDFVSKCLIRVLGVDSLPENHVQVPLFELGLDSLMTLELRNMLSFAFKRQLSSTLALDYPTVDSLARMLAGDLHPYTERSEIGTDETDLTEEEANALLEKELLK
jgi:NADPH:quinone reductase-like Zn-dependent oxidoreductase/acyl carrier protein